MFEISLKKLFLLLLIFISGAVCSFAEEATDAVQKIQEEESDSNSAIIFPEQNSKKAILQNLFPGFGKGSFAQNDKLGGALGVVFSTGTTIGTAAFAGSAGLYCISAVVCALAGPTALQNFTNEFAPFIIISGCSTLAFLSAGIAWSIARPIAFKKNFEKNNNLENINLSVQPFFSLNEFGAVAVIRF